MGAKTWMLAYLEVDSASDVLEKKTKNKSS